MSALGAIIGGASNVIGGLVDARTARSVAQKEQDTIREQTAANTALQKEFAQHGVAWKVQDAIEAGVHPLFALGASTSQFAPSPVIPMDGGRGGAGRAMGQAIRQVGATAEQYFAQQNLLKMQEATVEKDQAIADYYRSEAARNRQIPATKFPDAVVHSSYEGGMPTADSPTFHDVTKVQASPTYSRSSSDPQVAAGSAPFWRAFQLRKEGLMIDLPYSEEGPSESLQDLPLWMYPEVVRHNMTRYGANWLIDFLKAYPDSPMANWLRRPSE